MNDEFQDPVYPPATQSPSHPDRRMPSEASLLRALMEQLMERMNALDVKMTQHATTQPEAIRVAISAAMNACLPDGDADGHRRAHAAWIKREEERAQFWQELRLALAKWVGLGLLGFFVAAAWHALLKGPK